MFNNGNHPSFLNKPEEGDSIWRYMDLARFMSLLEDQSLYFTRANLMRDRWEGYEGPGPFPKSIGHIGNPDQRFDTYINCWHVSEYESAAMWEIYQREGRGVALRSTWGRLTGSLQTDFPIFGGLVNYIDYNTFTIPRVTGFDPYMYKRISFAHEQEARLVLWSQIMGGPINIDLDDKYELISLPTPEIAPGYSIPVDLDYLVDTIYVAPESEPWVVQLVASICKRYGLNKSVLKSEIGLGPLQ